MAAALLLLLLTAPQAAVTVPRVAEPTIDGQLGEAAWQQACRLSDFTRPGSEAAPAKSTTAWLGFDARALYIAFRCEEPAPGKLKAAARAGSTEVWQDDCVEIFLRSTGHPLEFEQFIVNSRGVTQALRQRRTRDVQPWQPTWSARSAITADAWTVEIAIPFSSLERPAPKRGDRLGLKLGREDYTSGQAVLSAWPARSSYAGTDDYGEVFLESDNLLHNADLRATRDLRPADWAFSQDNRDASQFTPATVDGTPAIKVDSLGRYMVMQQSQRLRPRRDYLLSMRVAGTAPIYFRARCVLEPGGASTPTDVNYRPTDGKEVSLSLRFTAGFDGATLLVIGTVDGSPTGTSYIRELALREADTVEATGQAIPIQPGGITEVRRLLVADCRLSRGFCGSPVDGTTNSYGWHAGRWEYGMGGAGAGVGYGWGNNEGVHVTLAEESELAAVQIRGGIRARLYGAGAEFDRPGSARLLYQFPGGSRRSRALLDVPVRTSQVSFFGVDDGHLADVQLFSVAHPASAPAAQPFPAATTAGELTAWLEGKAGTAERAPQQLGPTLALAAGQTVQLISEPLVADTAWEAVVLEGQVTRGPARLPLTITIHDPLNPRLELVVVDLELPAEGGTALLAFPTQLVPAGTRLWLSVRSEADAELASPTLVRLVTRPRAERESAALAYRTLLMRSFFSAASEARQWGTIRPSTNLDEWVTTNQWGQQVLEVMRTIDHAGYITPDDDLVRQYREWVYRSLKPVELKPELPTVVGAPDWAVAARQAWLLSREVARWWLDHRLAPNGELGGLVGDDSDMYQNWADLPLLESDGVGGRVRRAGEQLMELAMAENLTGGLNRHATDPLHAYEEGVNQLALMTLWSYGDPIYLERCFENARNTAALTVMTTQGHRHFRSQVIGAQDVSTPRASDVDGDAHPLMWHPSLEVAWYNRSPAVLKWLDEWATGWLAHMAPGKHAESVEVATETNKSVRQEAFRGGYGSQGVVFISLYLMTGDTRYLGPLLAEWRETGRSRQGGAMLQKFAELLPTGSLGPNEVEAQRANPITCYRLHGDKTALVEALLRDAAELQRFPAMYTSAEVFTDRVFLYALSNAARCYLGGDWTRNSFVRDHAVSWSGFGTDYAALVQTNRPDQLRVLLYNFADQPLQGQARLWRLAHGRYRMRLGQDSDGDDRLDQATTERELEIRRGDRLDLLLPPRQVMVLELQQTAPLDDLPRRPDLALAQRELKVTDGTVTGLVHSIGGAPAPASAVVLLDGEGRRLASAALPPLAAPLDLLPKTATFRLEGLPARGAWRVVVDPDGAIDEISEENNEARSDG